MLNKLLTGTVKNAGLVSESWQDDSQVLTLKMPEKLRGC